MTNYIKTTDFAAKDALPSGNSAKIVKGTEIDTEFNNIATSSATKANSNNSALTGTTTFETISDGAIAITAFVDEDNMASNSATLVPTQQSVKAYVDSQVTAQDLDFQADSGGALSIDLDSETLTFTGGTGVDTSGSGNAVTFAIDSTVATLTGTQTLTNKTLTSPTLNTPTIGTSFTIGSATITEAELEILDGATVTTAELNYVDGVTSAIQTQLDTKAPLASPTFTGTVTVPGLTTTANVLFGDGDKAIFGAGSDLSIYSDGTQSFIQEDGPGALYIQGTHLNFNNAAGNASYITAVDGGAVTLFSAGSAKLATTSTGISVSGAVGAPSSEDFYRIKLRDTGGIANDVGIGQPDADSLAFNFTPTSGGHIAFFAGSSEKVRIDSSGNVGIGTSSPDALLRVNGTAKIGEGSASNTSKLMVNTASGVAAGIQLFQDGNESWIIENPASTTALTFANSGTERMRVTSAGIDVTGTTDTDNLTIAGAQGTSGQVLTSSGSGVSWADASGGGIDTFNVTGVQSNRFYSGLYETFAGSTFTLSTTTVYYLPFVVWEDCTIDGFATSINGGTGNSGDVAQIAIYGPLPSSMSNVPHKITTSTFAVDSGYGKTVSITPTAFTKGVYFYAIAANTSSLAIRAFETPKRYINYMVGVSSNANPGGLYDAQYSQNTVSTWPHTFQTQISSPTQANHHNADVPHFQYLVQ